MSVESKPKGRPPQLARIQALEANVAALQEAMTRLIKAQPSEVIARQYERIFDKWPGTQTHKTLNGL
jgi:hypothetical protein